MKKYLLVSSLLVVSSLTYAGEKCKYTLDKDTAQVGWTAFKTTEKLAVNGTFKKVTVKGKLKTKKLADLFKKLSVTVDLSSADTGNPARDKTLTEFFFDGLKGGKAQGKVKSVNEAEKTFVLALTLNGKTEEVPMKYELGADHQLKATGSLDLVNFDGSKALASLNEKCHALHQGKDGVSKTWSDVNLNLSAAVLEECK